VVLNAAIVGLGWWGKELVRSVQGSSKRIRFVRGVTLESDLARELAGRSRASPSARPTTMCWPTAVSTPSRFERAAKDIQLSSLLAILQVLGMTDKRTLIFDEEYKRDSGDAITFWGNEGNSRVRCRILRKALDDHFSDGGRLRLEAAFEKHRPEIEALARRKYLLGQKEPDGTVLITTQDLN
jgi:hypothetical protein